MLHWDSWRNHSVVGTYGGDMHGLDFLDGMDNIMVDVHGAPTYPYGHYYTIFRQILSCRELPLLCPSDSGRRPQAKADDGGR
jgi:hypothetical protein